MIGSYINAKFEQFGLLHVRDFSVSVSALLAALKWQLDKADITYFSAPIRVKPHLNQIVMRVVKMLSYVASTKPQFVTVKPVINND